MMSDVMFSYVLIGNCLSAKQDISGGVAKNRMGGRAFSFQTLFLWKSLPVSVRRQTHPVPLREGLKRFFLMKFIDKTCLSSP